MDNQKVGKIIFWIGVAYLLIVNIGLSWYLHPILRYKEPSELANSVWAIDGFLFWIWILSGPVGSVIALFGLLILAEKSGWMERCFIALIALLLHFIGFSEFQFKYKIPEMYGAAGTLIALSFIGVFWAYTKFLFDLDGLAKTGAYLKIFGYFFLILSSYSLCIYFSTPKLAAFGFEAFVKPESILFALTLGWVFLFLGYILSIRAEHY